MHKKIKYFWLAAVIVFIDQLSKHIITSAFLPNQVNTLLPFFNLTLSYNTGAAFGFLNNQPQFASLAFWLFSSIAFIFSICIIIWLCRLPTQSTYLSVGLSSILGGAIGNLIDRLLYGHVIDFLQFHYNTWYFPTFNIADTAISIGAGILFLSTILKAN